MINLHYKIYKQNAILKKKEIDRNLALLNFMKIKKLFLKKCTLKVTQKVAYKEKFMI